MARDYDSSRRKEAAQQTRAAIAAAAFNRYNKGSFDIELIARDAGVSVSTVRKHFATRERLAASCAAYGVEQAAMPDMAGLASIPDARERLVETVRQAFELHESLFGQMWAASNPEDDSPVFAMTLQRIEGPLDSLVNVAVEAWPDGGEGMTELRGLLAGMLRPLTYRGLRVQGGLSPAQATGTITKLLLSALETGSSWSDRETAYR